ncbi:hypothetical protein [Candidatus Kryptobacter tengchongensis]|uniref:DUF5683 domain-containing protein n=1 Tax=Kryptobacter tengchongensis TaxID=1643429 RepID=A0A916LJT3_KRYT1|nr:hypothetical protein [Candidatus Kryptobacter tengchongensis]CUT02416.1 hypothetical protein JGI25_01059 [Candidatus Kryptobacter tengchongensis]
MVRYFCVIFLFASVLTAQDLKFLTGQVGIDLGMAQVQNDVKKLSPLKAGLMSAVVPGSGELYTKSYLKSALFFTVEIVSWYFYFTYTKRGDEQTQRFKQYADENWSVVDYAKWMNEWMTRYGGQDAPIISINPNENLKPWQRIDWVELNQAEEYISRKAGGFSHRLPFYGEQQYYELIGKYHQYAPGWNDFDKNFVPEDISLLSPTPRFKFYSLERGKANDFYSIATTSAFVIVVNHILSAMDATVSAILHNKRVKTETSLNYNFYFGLVAKAKLSVEF